MSRLGVERGSEVGGLHALEDALEEGSVHAADELSVFLGELVKWTVGEPDLPLVGERRVATFCQHLARRASLLPSAGRDACGVGRLLCLAMFAGIASHRCGEQSCERLVISRRLRGVELSPGDCVELGSASGSRPGSARESGVGGGEQASGY